MAKVTLKDIAEKAGVSVSAVSLALGGKGSISKRQRERIHEIADELGYVPNPLLSSLAAKRFRSGGYATGIPIALLEYSMENVRPSIYRSEIIRVAKQLGYQVRLITKEELKEYNDLSKTLYRSGVQGVIVTGQPCDEFVNRSEAWEHFSLVQCGRLRTTAPIHTVRSDIFRSIKLVYSKLLEKGYQRIGFAMGRHPDILEDDEARIGAALGLMQLHAKPQNIIQPYSGQHADETRFKTWVDKEQPDVIIGFGISQYYNLLKFGYSIPKDFGFASLHLHLHDRENQPITFAGLLQNTNKIAEQSVVLLDQLIRYNSRGFPDIPQHTLIPSSWVEGDTLCTINQPEMTRTEKVKN
ncbi:MAG: LacI family DNA-binding transcriptional regulator [Verrucomicrobiales bacterium]